MAYSETRIVIGGLAHVPILIFIAYFIRGKFVSKPKKTTETVVKEKRIKGIDTKETVLKEEKTKAIKKISSKQDNIEEKAEEVIKKFKKIRKDKKKKKKKDMKRD